MKFGKVNVVMTQLAAAIQISPGKGGNACPAPAETRTTKRTIFRPQGMGFRLSYKCLIGCRHCYQKSAAQSDVAIEKDRLMATLKEGYAAGMRNVGFSGGEPFLCAETVFKGIETAKMLGYDGNIGVQTNGFWGKTPKSARTIIDKLAKAGFSPPTSRINLSVGEFHQEWIPMSTISNIISAYWETFKHPLFLNVTFSKGNRSIFQKMCDHFEKCGIPSEAYTPLIYPSVAHVGRANEVIAEDVNPPVPVANFKECGAINKFTVEPTGRVAPCCGFNRFINGVCIGNIYENSIQEIVANTNANIIYHYIKFKPLHEIHRLLSERFDLKTHYRHKCELCQELFGTEAHIAYLEEIAEKALAGILNPDSKPGSTRYFREEKPAPKIVLPEPAQHAPSKADLAELEKRLAALELENAQLHQAISEALLKGRTLVKTTVRIAPLTTASLQSAHQTGA